MGNILTDKLSSIWTPHQVKANVFMTASISASSILSNSSTYAPGWVTGSQRPAPQATIDLGMPPTRFYWDASTNSSWLNSGTSDTDASLYFDLDNGTGRTEVVNCMIIGNASAADYNAQGYAISGSQDKITWTPLTSSGASYGTPGKGFNATLTFSNTTAYRYYKVKLLGQAGTYDGFTNIWAWDVNKFTGGGSTHGSASVNLMNPNEANVTASFRGESVSHTDLDKLASPERDQYGWYWNDDIGSIDLSWGDGPKLFRGMLCNGYDTDDYVPSKFQVWKSNTGNYNDWEFVNTVDFNAQQDAGTFEYYFLDFGTPIKTQYLRLIFFEEFGETTDIQTALAYNCWMYGMVSASAPPVPTDLITSAQGNHVGLSWTQNSGSDNRPFDIFYNIERSSDGGSNYTKIATVSGSIPPTADTGSSGTNTPTYYMDTSVPDGNYLYRVQAANIQHLTTGSYVTSDSISLPQVASTSNVKVNFGSISTPIIADGLIFNMDAANRASYVPNATTSYNTIDLTQSGSFISDPTFITQPVSASCWNLDGVDDYIDIGTDSSLMIGTGDFTISGWIKLDTTNSGYAGMIGKFGTISTTHKDYMFGLFGMKLVILAGVGTSGTWGGYKVGATTLTTGQWYHIAVTLDRDGDATLYLNGSSDGSVAMTSPTVDIISSNTYSIGNSEGYFEGQIANIQLHNRKLLASEVLHNYNALKSRFT